MAVQREDFEHTGPKQLTDVDWTNDHHLRAVAASLVQGAYNLEFDHQDSQDPQVRWWHFFHFELKRKLIDDKDSSIYGVVYEIKCTNPNHLPKSTPKFVIAFRGTILSTKSRDMKLNMKVFAGKLHKDKSRFKHALEAVKAVVQEAWPANIWLVGHSLGSAIAMLVGKSMAQEGKNLKTFLFNPPFLRYSVSKNIKNPTLKDGIRSTKNVIKAGISFVGGDHLWQELYDQFNALSYWIPNLFVNKDDPICSENIDHFRNRKIEDEMRSIRSAIKAAFVKDPQLPIYLLPKAYLTISKNSSSLNICKVLEAHGLKQWWYQMSIGPGFANSSTEVLIDDAIPVGEP
ncbi:hypothetical protein PVL29_021684 [Vitis rotundifolia]|uniref:Fungal lipase-type domain-containing protein n=1 Tax=Vitis rotundifolia TaxID=103349 RepID=A0AA38Z048_VITRO|nr:hypothetical protein PVL29_021684 [Vitis rotundifolia]